MTERISLLLLRIYRQAGNEGGGGGVLKSSIFLEIVDGGAAGCSLELVF